MIDLNRPDQVDIDARLEAIANLARNALNGWLPTDLAVSAIGEHAAFIAAVVRDTTN
jgi:hypothetical protein